jgi:hypothetical protein
MVMQEFGKMRTVDPAYKDMLHTIAIGEELSEESLQAYDDWLHTYCYPPQDCCAVDALVCDGHEKVLTRLCEGEMPGKRSGNPPKDKQPKRFKNGWFMVVDPRTRRIVSVSMMHKPECNDTAIGALERVIHTYPKVNVLIYDRACKLMPQATKRSRLRQIKTWAVDKMHGRKHTKGCKCNPHTVKKIWNRLRGINSSVCEQTFSWFRGYASTLNTMSPIRHRFMVLRYCQLHNGLVESGDVGHLNPCAKTSKIRKRPSSSYHCVSKKPAVHVKPTVQKKPARAA